MSCKKNSSRRRLCFFLTASLAALFCPLSALPTLAAEVRVSNQGKTWLIDTQDPKVEIRISENGRVVTISDGTEGREIGFNTHSQRLLVGEALELAVPLDEERPFHLRRGGKVIATIRKVPNPGDADSRAVPRAETPFQNLYTIDREGRLLRITVRGENVKVTPISQLPAPFRSRGVLIEGLAMNKEGNLYAALNGGIDFTRESSATGQDRQEAESWLYHVDLNNPKTKRVGPIGHKQVDGLSFSADGKLYGVTSILGGGSDARLLEIDVKTARARTVASKLPLEDLDCMTVVSPDKAFIVDGMGLGDAFYSLRLDGRGEASRLAPTPNIIHNSRDLEGLTLGQNDGFLYAFTSPDAGPNARVHLVQIDPKTFKHKDLGLMEFGAYCLTSEPSTETGTNRRRSRGGANVPTR